MIEIIAPGFYSTVQDAGRTGYRSVGVGSSDAMDTHALAIGNAALGNAPDDAAIEITFGGFEIRAHADFEICLAGASVDAQIDDRPISRWWVHTVYKGHRGKHAPINIGLSPRHFPELWSNVEGTSYPSLHTRARMG
jgi:allophanate hydrolase subunit 2